MWAGLPEYPFIRHVGGRRFEARRRDAVVALEAASTHDARRAIDGLHTEVVAELGKEEVAVAAVARAMDLARMLRDAATGYGGDEAAPVPRPQLEAPTDRRALEGHVAAVRAAEAAWADERLRERRAAARIVAGHVEDGLVTVEVRAPNKVRRARKKKSPITQEE